MLLALLCSTASAVDIPVVGRPAADFHDAAGENVTIAVEVAPRELALGDDITLTLRVEGLLNAAEAKRPDLRLLPDFHEAFVITDEPSPATASVYVYRLRPRTTDVKEVPEFLYRYFKPSRKAGGAPPSQWFPLTSTDPVPITVRPAAEAPPSAVPLDVPDFARAVTAGDALLGSTEPDDVPFGWLIAGMLVPPLAFLVVRGTHRQNRSRRRSKAGRDALRALARGREPHVVIRAYACRRAVACSGRVSPMLAL